MTQVAGHRFLSWLFVINGVACVLHTISSRHLQRDPIPKRSERRSIGTSIRIHLLFRHPTGEAAWRYNALQSQPDLPDRDLRAAVAGGDRRTGDVAPARRGVSRLGRNCVDAIRGGQGGRWEGEGYDWCAGI